MKQILLTLLLATTAFARTKEPELPVRDAGKLAAVKRVALIAVYGPDKVYSGFCKTEDRAEQPLYDAAEQRITEALKAHGYEVVVPKALVESDYPDLYINNAPARQRKDLAQAQNAIRNGYLLALNGTPLSSTNTHLFYGGDYNWKITAQNHENDHRAGDNDSFAQPPAKYDDTTQKALAQLAAKAGADAYVVVRVIPVIATTVAAKTSKWNPIGNITRGINTVHAMKEGDHGFVTIDMAMADTQNTTLFQDQVIGMSKEGSGVGHGFNMKMDPEEMKRLTSAALDEALPQLVAHLDGK